MKKVKVIELVTPHCGVCKMIAPAVDAALKELGDVEFSKLCIGVDPEAMALAKEYGITQVPTFMFYVDGTLSLDRLSGTVSKDTLVSTVRDLQK